MELSGGFTLCRQIRPSSGRAHTFITYSVRDDDYFMNETGGGGIMLKVTHVSKLTSLFVKYILRLLYLSFLNLLFSSGSSLSFLNLVFSSGSIRLTSYGTPIFNQKYYSSSGHYR